MRTILNSRASAGLVLAVLVLAVLTSGLVACSSAGRGARDGSGRVRVVVAENWWGNIVEQLAGPAGDVTSIVDSPDADPHDYEPTPQDARAIASAQLVIENGIGYDPWFQKLVDADGEPDRRVLNVGRLLGVPDGGNPHQWYSRAAVDKFVARVTRELQAIDPKRRSDYEHRAREYETKSLAKYSALVARIRGKYAGSPIGASESIVVPLADTLGLKVLTPSAFLDAVAEGNEPSASDKVTVDTQIRRHRIKVFVFNTQNSTPDVQRLVDAARRAGIPVATVTESLIPATATFQDWQTGELRGLLAALDRASR